MKLLRKVCLCLLLLGSIWGNTHQVTAEDKEACSDTQYMSEVAGRCCSRCPPGSYMKEECTETLDTQCRPCENGTYAAKNNYAKSCRRCNPCGLGLVMRQPCSATQATVCGCEDGYTCARHNGINTCTDCMPIIHTTTASTDPPLAAAPPEDYLLWIGLPLLVVSGIILAVSCYYRAGIVKKIGRVFKTQSNVLSIPETETTAFNCNDVTRAVHGAEPLLHHGTNGYAISMPTEEVGRDLAFPIQETDATQPGECTLNTV